MIKIKVTSGKLYPRAHGKKRYFYIYLTVNEKTTRVSCSQYEKIFYLIDRYATSKTKLRSGCGCVASGPDNLAVALDYLSARNTQPPENSELDTIVETGITPMQKANVVLGGKVEIKNSRRYYQSVIGGNAVVVSIHDFPMASVTIKNAGHGLKPVKIPYNDETIPLLKALLRANEDDDQIPLIEAIALVRSRGKRFQLAEQFVKNRLTKKMLAPIVMQTAVHSKNPAVWRRGLKWLTLHGYNEEASELTIRKTLMAH